MDGPLPQSIKDDLPTPTILGYTSLSGLVSMHAELMA